jgi:two-component system sensor histidine kinase KdpD
VLMNLLDNAVEYTPAGSPVEISGSALAGEFRLDVSDRGPGLAPGTEKQIFEKFFRAAPQGTRRGIGLGLAICRGIIESHGGKIIAFNRAGGGATFSITLPIESVPDVKPVE